MSQPTTASMTDGLRIVFAGTPEFAAHHLQALLASRHSVVAVYSQPDRPAGRGKKLSASPVKALAAAEGVPVYQPISLKDPVAQAELAGLQADIMVVVAYGLLLPKAVLETPELGCINVHASLLPRWRGAAPIQRALAAGDAITGVTIMQMDVGLDTGAMLVKAECPILSEDTGGSLHDRLLTIGVPALLEALDQLQAGTARGEVQDDQASCYAPKLHKDEALLNWRQPATALARKVRAFNPFPVAFTQRRGTGNDERIRIWAAQHSSGNTNQASGTVVAIDAEGIHVSCGEGNLVLQQLQLPGKKALPVSELLRGHPDLFAVGDLLELPA